MAAKLLRVPIGCAPKYVDRWRQLIPITVEEFERVLQKVDKAYSLDFDNTTIGNWEERAGALYGMRLRG